MIKCDRMHKPSQSNKNASANEATKGLTVNPHHIFMRDNWGGMPNATRYKSSDNELTNLEWVYTRAEDQRNYRIEQFY